MKQSINPIYWRAIDSAIRIEELQTSKARDVENDLPVKAQWFVALPCIITVREMNTDLSWDFNYNYRRVLGYSMGPCAEFKLQERSSVSGNSADHVSLVEGVRACRIAQKANTWNFYCS